MGKVTLAASLFFSLIACELVVTPEKEGSSGFTEFLLAHAEVVENYQQEGPCPEVQDEVRILRYYVQLGPNEREERNVGALVSPGHVVEHKYSWSGESWLPRSQRIKPSLNCLEQTDLELLEFLRKELLWPPFQVEHDKSQFEEYQPRADGWKGSFSQGGQDIFLDEVIFKSQLREGFFIEAGADDLVTDSNTLFFEIERDWTGILVEPALWEKRSAIKRNAWCAPVCLGLHTKPHFAPFAQKALEEGMAGLVAEEGEDTNELQCFPLASILFAVGNQTVNYLSLDIEGAEIQILQTLPWRLVDIEVIGVEMNHLGEVFPGSRGDLHQFLKQQNYAYVGTIHVDDLFVREDLLDRYKVDEQRVKDFPDVFSFKPPAFDKPASADNQEMNKVEL